jgi:hypothetical protein
MKAVASIRQIEDYTKVEQIWETETYLHRISKYLRFSADINP